MKRRALAIVFAHAAITAGAIYLIGYHLPLFADFSYLLPQDAPAVRDLRRLEARVKANDTALAVITAPTSDDRAAAVRELGDGLRTPPPHLGARGGDDDTEAPAFFKAPRH